MGAQREPSRGRGDIKIDRFGGDKGIRKDKNLNSFLPAGQALFRFLQEKLKTFKNTSLNFLFPFLASFLPMIPLRDFIPLHVHFPDKNNIFEFFIP